MHRDEADQEVVCAGCGALMDAGSQGAYVFEGGDSFLCQGCAGKRGGVYDSDRERWTSAPRTNDLESGKP